MSTSTSLQDLSKPVDMTGWADPYASGDIPQPIAPIRPLGSTTPSMSSTTSPATTTPSAGVVSGIINAAGNMLGLPAGTLPGTNPTGWVGQVETYIASRLEDTVFIVIGLILIAAAVFSFKGAQDAVVSTAKKAAEVAA